MKKRRKRRKRKGNKAEQRLLLATGIVLGVLLAVLIGALVFFLVKKTSDIPGNVDEWEESEIDQDEGDEEASEDEESSEVVKIDYPAPEYDFKTDEVTIEIPGLTQSYTLAWVSDLHLTSDFEPADDVMAEHVETIKQRHDALFINSDAETGAVTYSEELWPEIIKYLNYTEIDGKRLDGIIFGGDIMDYCSRSNLDLFLKEYQNLDTSIPLLYIRADHDYGFWYGGNVFTEPMAEALHKDIAGGDELNQKYLDFGEFVVIGVNRSNKDMSQAQYDIIKSQYDKAKQENKPVIAVTHVPYESQDGKFKEFSMEVKGKVYYWSYFLQEGNNIPNVVTRQYLDEIYAEDTPVVKVLAGHMHAGWDGMITPQVSQHIFAPAFQGNIGIIHVVPASE